MGFGPCHSQSQQDIAFSAVRLAQIEVVKTKRHYPVRNSFIDEGRQLLPAPVPFLAHPALTFETFLSLTTPLSLTYRVSGWCHIATTVDEPPFLPPIKALPAASSRAGWIVRAPREYGFGASSAGPSAHLSFLRLLGHLDLWSTHLAADFSLQRFCGPSRAAATAHL